VVRDDVEMTAELRRRGRLAQSRGGTPLTAEISEMRGVVRRRRSVREPVRACRERRRDTGATAELRAT